MAKKIKNKLLEGYIKSDIQLVNLPIDFELEFRGYSKNYYGRYYIRDKKVVIYIHDVFGNQIPYHEILDTALHEAIHHYQHHYQEGFVRVKGVMHNITFKNMYEDKMYKLREWEVIPSA